MLGKWPRPLTREPEAGFPSGTTSPTRSEATGLRIVAAMEKSGGLPAKLVGSPMIPNICCRLGVGLQAPEMSLPRVHHGGGAGTQGGRQWGAPHPEFAGDSSVFPTPDFLSSCYMCRKNLHGKDIYMYRGERAFCSEQCRYKQIASDERKEKCGSGVADVSTPANSGGRVFSPGLVAA